MILRVQRERLAGLKISLPDYISRYQLTTPRLRLAKPDALVMHCLPAHRGQEIDDATLEAHAGTIFDQSENRLHVQKAVLLAVSSSG